MKYLIVILVVLAVWWLLRSGGRAGAGGKSASQNKKLAIEEMVSCAQCGLHLPKSEALAAHDAYYCSDAHRLAHEHEDAAR